MVGGGGEGYEQPEVKTRIEEHGASPGASAALITRALTTGRCLYIIFKYLSLARPLNERLLRVPRAHLGAKSDIINSSVKTCHQHGAAGPVINKGDVPPPFYAFMISKGAEVERKCVHKINWQ